MSPNRSSLLQLPPSRIFDHQITGHTVISWMPFCPLSAGVVGKLFDPGRRQAFRLWKAAGCPRLGPVVEKRKKCKRDVSSYLSKCRAHVERISIQKCDETFQFFHPKRFKSNSQKTGGSSLMVNGSLTTHPPEVLQH